MTIHRAFALRYTLRVKLLCALFLALLACGGTPSRTATPTSLQAACAEPLHWNGAACVADDEARAELAKAETLLADFEVESALLLLKSTLERGPHRHDLLVTLYEQLGIAYSYLKKEDEALSAFERLLALDPGHLLSYTLSPQATFLYERARKSSESRAPARVDVSWPQGLKESDRVPLTVEVVSDPLGILHSVAFFVREQEEQEFQRLQFSLPSAGEVSQVVLPPANTKREAVLELYGSAYDETGNEVMLWFDARRPRELPLGYQAPTPWYRKWWVWAAIGGGAAAATGTTVYLLGLDPADTVTGGFSLGR